MQAKELSRKLKRVKEKELEIVRELGLVKMRIRW
jgi:hypothetical protein